MNDHLLKLAEIGSRAILTPPAEAESQIVNGYGNPGGDLLAIRWLMNGS